MHQHWRLAISRHLRFFIHRFSNFSRNKRPVGSRHTFASRDSTLSNLLQIGFRFLRSPLPANPWAHFALAFSHPSERLTSLSCSALVPKWVRLLQCARPFCLRKMSAKHLYQATYRFGSSLSASLACCPSRHVLKVHLH